MPPDAARPIHSDDGNVVIVASVPPRIAARLKAYCDALGEDIGDVIADAVDLHIDAIEPAASTWSPEQEISMVPSWVPS